VRASNTHLLEKSFGWKGICVEPNATFFSALTCNRDCLCVNCCLYDREGDVDFLEDARMLGGVLFDYHPSLLNHAKQTFGLHEDDQGRLQTVRKQARTIRSILHECGAPSIIDYWSLDTEGSELRILKSFPFEEYSFRVLTVEHNNLPIRKDIREFLESVGYRMITAVRIDDCYVKRVS
jgi:Methyltransferase FkbM domain